MWFLKLRTPQNHEKEKPYRASTAKSKPCPVLGISALKIEKSKGKEVSMALNTPQNIQMLATILQSEASIGNTAERHAVGWTVLNRMARNHTEAVSAVAGAYSTAQQPTTT